MHRLIDKRELTSDTFILKLERNDLEFVPGQYIRLNIPGTDDYREYSIYSGIDDDFIELLVKEINSGSVSRKLKSIKKGAFLNVSGPFGSFTIKNNNLHKKYYFVSTGTGIAPFHSFVKSYSDINYIMLHGIRNINESYEKETYEVKRYCSCTAEKKGGTYNGKLTDYLKKSRIDNESYYYLCGNSAMIGEVYDYLKLKKVPTDNIFAEVYF